MKKHSLFLFALISILLVQAMGMASQASSKESYKRSVEHYSVPDVTLVNQDGKRVRLPDLVNSGRPVVLDFIYGTCTTICPVLSANFTNFQRKLGEGAGKAQLISITIDPEHDTPAIMKKYLKNYLARPGWDFLTGSRQDIDLVMRAFSAYVPNKMSHLPIIFIRVPRTDQWVRIYGMISTSDFMKEFERVARP